MFTCLVKAWVQKASRLIAGSMWIENMQGPIRICKEGSVENIMYDSHRFMLLKKLRETALKLMSPLSENGIKSYVYGSLARGDVRPDSDVDVVILQPVNPAVIESLYLMRGLEIIKKVIVQATPSYTPKLYLWFDVEGRNVVNFPLARLRSRELEFYRFGGILDDSGVEGGKRVPGVDKRLMLIIPTEEGHRGECILGREGYVSKILGVSESLVRERISVLTRRESHGRTGVFLEHVVEGDVLEAVRILSRRNKFFRKMVGLE